VLEKIRSKNLHTWLPGWLRHRAEEATTPRFHGTRHLVFAFCDHYEPRWHQASFETGDERVRAWEEGYPALVRDFRDADGRPPQHSFFFPAEEYSPEYFDRLGRLVAAGYGEVEIHLHHDGATARGFADDMRAFIEICTSHGHLSRDPDGRPRFAFIHGNWALANSRADGRWCGVDNEIPLLFKLGCYADFTFPSAPDDTQPNIVNRIYWPVGDTARRRAYERGERARVGALHDDRLLMIEGPIALARRGRGLRIESAAITAMDPPSPSRVRTWVDQNVHVEGRPEWVFVKVHTHGAPEREATSLLGDGGRALHRELTTRYNDGRNWVLHYVTAREMFNISIAAMEGRSGDPNLFRNHVLPPPPARAC
jgi:hypothetical protein